MFLSAYLANGTLPSGEGGNDTQGTLHENVAGHAGRDGRPVPYGDHRNCANVSTEFVGEAFRLPRGGTQAAPYGPQGGRQMRARCGGSRYCPDPLDSLRLCGNTGRETRPLREGRGCADVSTEFVGEAFRLPLGVRTSQMERYRAAKVVTIRRAPGTNCLSALPTRAAKAVTIRRAPCTNMKPAMPAGTGNPSPTRGSGVRRCIDRIRRGGVSPPTGRHTGRPLRPAMPAGTDYIYFRW